MLQYFQNLCFRKHKTSIGPAFKTKNDSYLDCLKIWYTETNHNCHFTRDTIFKIRGTLLHCKISDPVTIPNIGPLTSKVSLWHKVLEGFKHCCFFLAALKIRALNVHFLCTSKCAEHLNPAYFLINNIYELALNSASSLSILSERAETLWAHEWKSIFLEISRLILTLPLLSGLHFLFQSQLMEMYNANRFEKITVTCNTLKVDLK